MTEFQLFSFLKGKADDSEINNVISELKSKRYLSDKRFAEEKIYKRIKYSFWGKEKIQAELFDTGVSEELIIEALKHISEEEWRLSALNMVKKTRALLKNKNDHFSIQKKLMANGHDRKFIQLAFGELGLKMIEEE